MKISPNPLHLLASLGQVASSAQQSFRIPSLALSNFALSSRTVTLLKWGCGVGVVSLATWALVRHLSARRVEVEKEEQKGDESVELAKGVEAQQKEKEPSKPLGKEQDVKVPAEKKTITADEVLEEDNSCNAANQEVLQTDSLPHIEPSHTAEEVVDPLQLNDPQFTATVRVAECDTGTVGANKQTSFTKPLTTPDDAPFKFEPSDVYLPVMFSNTSTKGENPWKNPRGGVSLVTTEGTINHFPDRLFLGKKEGDTVRFRYSGVLIELCLGEGFNEAKSRLISRCQTYRANIPFFIKDDYNGQPPPVPVTRPDALEPRDLQSPQYYQLDCSQGYILQPVLQEPEALSPFIKGSSKELPTSWLREIGERPKVEELEWTVCSNLLDLVVMGHTNIWMAFDNSLVLVVAVSQMAGSNVQKPCTSPGPYPWKYDEMVEIKNWSAFHYANRTSVSLFASVNLQGTGFTDPSKITGNMSSLGILTLKIPKVDE